MAWRGALGVPFLFDDTKAIVENPTIRSLARIDYQGPIAFESFSSAVVDPVLSNMLGVWRNLWSDGYDLARHAKAFMEDQIVAAKHATGRS